MNRKGEAEESGEVLRDNLIYILLLILAVGIVFIYLQDQKSGSAIREDYYAQQLVFILNHASPGDYIKIDVHKATEIAKKNKINSFNNLFSFDSRNNNVCVKLDLGESTCLAYFRDLTITEVKMELASPNNILSLKVVEGEGFR